MKEIDSISEKRAVKKRSRLSSIIEGIEGTANISKSVKLDEYNLENFSLKIIDNGKKGNLENNHHSIFNKGFDCPIDYHVSKTGNNKLNSNIDDINIELNESDEEYNMLRQNCKFEVLSPSFLVSTI